MTNYEATDGTNGDSELWLVRLPSGEVHSVTLEQLDSAYQRDLIGGDTEVLDEETGGWRKLSDLLGEEEAAPAPMTQVAVPCAPPVQSASSAVMIPPVAAPASTYPTRPIAAAGSTGATIPAVAASVERPAAVPSALSTPSPSLNSTAPVAFDLDDLELGGSPFKRKSRTPLYVAAGLVLALVGVGGAVASSEPDPVAGGAAVPAATQTALPTPPRVIPSEPEPAEEPKPAAKERFDEDTKRALAEAEKQYAKRRRGSKGRGKAATSRRRSRDEFRPTKGDRNDPLNGSL